jgi:hypothetical protein
MTITKQPCQIAKISRANFFRVIKENDQEYENLCKLKEYSNKNKQKNQII